MAGRPSPDTAPAEPSSPTGRTMDVWISRAAWVIALVALGVAAYVGWGAWGGAATPGAAASGPPPTLPPSETDPKDLVLPSLPEPTAATTLARPANLHTVIPDRPNPQVVTYTVDTGDSVFGIAQQFDITPETVLWANYDQLNDNPDFLALGMALRVPPVNGVYYQWQEGDSLEAVANALEADLEAILSWPGNNLDLIDPAVEPGSFVMVPGGHREFRQWLVPTIPRGAAGVSPSLYGPGACAGGYDGAYGSGAFIYPTFNHTLSGNDYWSGHLGIDLAAGAGDGIRAADAGVVVFSGWANGGYGYMVMIDHGNGYQTVYAHLSQAVARCGQSVGQGQVIGLAGNTGNSTGVHLHFEVRFQGGFVSPWFVLPAP